MGAGPPERDRRSGRAAPRRRDAQEERDPLRGLRPPTRDAGRHHRPRRRRRARAALRPPGRGDSPGRCWSSFTAAAGCRARSRATTPAAARWPTAPGCGCCRSTTAWPPSTPFPPRSTTRCRRTRPWPASPSASAPRPSRSGGDSVGGNLAAALCLHARDAGLRLPAFQWLLYPVTDAPDRHETYETYAEGFYLSAERMRYLFARYVPDPAERGDPRVAPAARGRPQRAAAGLRGHLSRPTLCAPRARPTRAASRRPARPSRCTASRCCTAT